MPRLRYIEETEKTAQTSAMIESARNDAATLDKVAEVSKLIKDNVFPNDPFSFLITDEKMVTVKAYDY